jgi:hypothetical protein
MTTDTTGPASFILATVDTKWALYERTTNTGTTYAVRTHGTVAADGLEALLSMLHPGTVVVEDVEHLYHSQTGWITNTTWLSARTARERLLAEVADLRDRADTIEDNAAHSGTSSPDAARMHHRADTIEYVLSTLDDDQQ